MSRVNYIVGIDPGSSPALCVLRVDPNSLMGFTIVDNILVKKKENFPLSALETALNNITLPSNNTLVVVEDVHAVWGSSAKATFNFGYAAGACGMYANGLGGTKVLIKPKAWQKVIIKNEDIKNDSKGKKDTKATSLSAARRILGSLWDDSVFLPTKRSSVVNHNLIDSFLIAYYGFLKHLD